MEWVLLLGGAFLAGLVDSVVGGGGLIQTPLLLSVFPSVPLPTLFCTNKISSIAGTCSAAIQYARKVRIPFWLVMPSVVAALVGSAVGAAVVSFLPNKAAKPLVLVLLIAVGAYTFLKPEFGKQASKPLCDKNPKRASGVMGGAIGFYDGFFGPGTGSFLIFGFVRLFGMDMLTASAAAKMVNLATNVAAITYFLATTQAMWKYGLTMAVANVVGAQVGTHLAVRHGSGFIRVLLLVVVSVLTLKIGYDVLTA